jgi:indolepyruvate decarboxylase
MGIWDSACPMPAGALPVANRPAGTESALAATIVGLIRAAQSPVILVGQEIQRYGLADKVGDLIAKLGVRWTTAVLSKSVLAEQGPRWIGVYDPPHSPPAIKNAVEHADFLVTLSAVFPNGYASLVQNAFGMVEIYDGKVRIKTGAKQNAEIGALVAALVTEAAKAPPKPVPPGATPAAPGPGAAPLTYRQVLERIAAVLDDTLLVIPDTFLGVFSPSDLPGRGATLFSCSAVWASIGHSVAAVVGASFGSARQPLVICGDGGFHMTATALSTMVQFRRNPIVVVLANGIYGFEQCCSIPRSSITRRTRRSPTWCSTTGVSPASPRGLGCLCQEDARASCCTRDEGRSFGVVL